MVEPVHIMTAEDRGWHKGSFKPSLQFGEDGKAWVFFDGMYNTGDPGPFPFALRWGVWRSSCRSERDETTRSAEASLPPGLRYSSDIVMLAREKKRTSMRRRQ